MPIHLPEEEMRPEHREPMRRAFEKAEDAGIVICVTASNRNTGQADNISEMEYLPKMPGVITAGDFDQENKRNPSSGTGPQVDIAAYGALIYSCDGTTKMDECTI